MMLSGITVNEDGVMGHRYRGRRKQRQNKSDRKIKELERRKAKGCLTGIIVYGVVVTAALCAMILLYGSKVRAEITADAETDISDEDGHIPAEKLDDNEKRDGKDAFEFSSEADDWNMILVNKWNPAPEGYETELADAEQGYQVDARIVEDLLDMLEDARAEGLSPRICSAYRSHEKQIRLYNNKVREYLDKGYSAEKAEEEAGKWVAVPGTSEHETGLAVDIVAASYQLLDEGQEKTKEQQWLMENCYKYGFILRYPNEKSELTGIYYEPWHYRYVGKEAAAQIFEMDICFEEYKEMLMECE